MAVLGEASLFRPAEDLAWSLVGCRSRPGGGERAGTTQISDNSPDSHQFGEARVSRVSELLAMPTRCSIRLAGRE
jgi:hypothetical protein